MSTTDAPLLEVRHLRVTLRTPRGPADAVRDLSFTLQRGQTLGLVGESGCGKSISALALMGLLPEGAQASGSIRIHGQELMGADERTLCALRGHRMAMVFQEPMTALNPLHTVGHQVAEPLRLHLGLGARDARERARQLLDRVGIPDAARRLDAYPHQFSGGQRQRITIAMALACHPDLLIADEPTTALDVTIQKQILDLMRDLVAERGMALILISHDLAMMAHNVRRMLVMYGGTVVESGETARVFGAHVHPYTSGLFGARPRLGTPRGVRLATIPGSVPELTDLPAGCTFADRCSFSVASCRTQAPGWVTLGDSHGVRCDRLDAVPGSAPRVTPEPTP